MDPLPHRADDERPVRFWREQIMFSSNDTPAEEFDLAARLGATINLDDFTHIAFSEGDHRLHPRDHLLPLQPRRRVPAGPQRGGLPGHGQPGDAKYGFTRDQLMEGFRS